MINYEEERIQRLVEAKNDSVDGEDMEVSFGQGSFGEHEILDRSSIMLSSWEKFILSHKTTLIRPDLFSKAKEIADLMAAFYLLVDNNEKNLS